MEKQKVLRGLGKASQAQGAGRSTLVVREGAASTR